MPLEDSTEISQDVDTARWLDGQVAPLDRQLDAGAHAESRWSIARMATFLLAALGWIPLRENPPLAAAMIVLGIVLFIVSIRWHRQAFARHAFLKLRKMVLDESLRRVGGRVVTIRSNARPDDVGVARSRLGEVLPAGATWPLTEQERDDLDLYAAPAGLFGLLNRTSTDVGAVRLRDVLESPLLEADRILDRQRAVRWLAGHHDERTRLLAALAGLRGLDAQMPIFERAVESARPVLPAAISWLLRAWSAGILAFALYACSRVLEEDYGPAILLALLMVVNVLVWVPLWSRVRHALLRHQRSFAFARQYVNVARQAAEDLPNQTQMAHLREMFDAIRRPAALPGALRWTAWSAEGGFVQVLLDLLVFYDVHVLEGIQRHVIPHREPLLAGLGALAELEALLSVGCFAGEQAVICWPEIVSGTNLSIGGGVHPLIAPAVAVPNNVSLAAQPNLWIITGSNMSGKSTFLRMIGVNVLLAQAAGVAVATQMAWSPLRLVSDLRIRDNLVKGESYFLAEVRHLRRMIVPAAGKAPILGLVDEPFRGTNHREQRGATLAIIEHLVCSKGLFLIATHDSTVTQLGDGVRAENHHFQEQLGPRELVFDYQLQPGPAVTRNAIRVLAREQYPADLIERALRYADGQQADDPAGPVSPSA
jgi:hypothetical protein